MEPQRDSTRWATAGGLARTGRGGLCALAAAALLSVAGCGSSSTDAAAPTTSATQPATSTTTPRAGATLAQSAARVRRQLRGIPQSGLVLGRSTAPITIVEYGAFGCPACAAVHRDVLPQVIERYVRTGKASLEFRGVAGETPSRARDLALASYAASAQRRGWDLLQLAYLQSLEPGTTTESAARLAAALGLDAKRLGADTGRPEWSTHVRAAASVAAATRMSTFPVFLVRARATPGRPFVVVTRPDSVRPLAAAVAKASKTVG